MNDRGGAVRLATVRTGEDRSGTDAEVAAHADGAVRLAWLLTGDSDAAHDIAADAIARVLVTNRRRGVDEVGPYLRRAVLNEVRDRSRRRTVARRRIGALASDDRGQRTTEDHVADRSALLAALERLPDRQRQCVVLRYYERLSVRETATAMDVSEGTVKSTTAKGLTALRGLLGEESR